MTAAGRPDYDSAIRIRSIPADEPMFVLRAQDALAAEAVRAWVALGHAAGVNEAVLEEALSQADRMADWPVKKLPDADHLTPDQAAQAAYAFRRRAQRAQPDVSSLNYILAERRGYALAEARLRALTRALQGCLDWLDYAERDLEIRVDAATGAHRDALARRLAEVRAFHSDIVGPALVKGMAEGTPLATEAAS